MNILQSKVLISPLNWGLGHATRCIPLIDSFIEKEWEVVLASDGEALELLKKEYPDLRFSEITSYKIKYPFSNAVINMIYNAWSFLKAINKENSEINHLLQNEKFDLLISDNRYGVRNRKIKSIFIGHQINLKTGSMILSKLASWVNKRMIRNFDELWIPDYKGSDSIAGDLSAPISKMRTKFIGPLSRFERKEIDPDIDICAVLSGPEPQRGRFEKQLIEQLSQLDESTVIISGRVDDSTDKMLNESTRLIGHLTSEALNDYINRSRIVIARSGYSTIMDLLKLDKMAILIPTPGQSEQVYLAKKLENHPLFITQRQKKINVPIALEELTRREQRAHLQGNFDVEYYL